MSTSWKIKNILVLIIEFNKYQKNIKYKKCPFRIWKFGILFFKHGTHRKTWGINITLLVKVIDDYNNYSPITH